MPTLGFVGVAVLILALLGALAFRLFAAAPGKRASPPPAAPAGSAASAAPPLSAEELQRRLAALARSAPAVESPSAMCYSMAAPPATADYVCPVDGSRTQYARGRVPVVRELPAMRLVVKSIPGLDASLDEREMCRKCTPNGRGMVALVVRHPDGQLVRTEGVSERDLQLLQEFLDGKLTHAGTAGERTPLKDHLPRIRTLLGIPEE